MKPDTSPDNDCELVGALLEYYIFERIPRLSSATGTGYKIRAKCSTTTDDTAIDVKSVILSSKGIVIDPFTNTVDTPQKRNKLYFFPRGLGIGNLTDVSSVITLSKSGTSSVTVTVTTGGEIR